MCGKEDLGLLYGIYYIILIKGLVKEKSESLIIVC